MNKKLIISLSVIGAVAAIAIGGTMAYFSDTETSTGNTFTAGTLDLNLDGGNSPVVGKFVVTNAKPGDGNWGYWTVKNVGTLDGYLDLESISKTNDDNNCTEPETTGGDGTCGPTGGGELGANMNITIFVDDNHDGMVDSGETIIYGPGTFDAIPTSISQNLLLEDGVEKYISLKWEIPGVTGNIIQSDSVSLGMTFELQQRSED